VRVPEFIIEFGGLLVPAGFDCDMFNQDAHFEHPFFERGSLYPYARWAGSFPSYFMAVPSRWIWCWQQHAAMESGLRFLPESLPYIDEEYPQYVAWAHSAMRARENFVGIELGARWGTWGARAVTFLRMLNSTLPYSLLYVEANPEHCIGLEQVHEVNNITNFTLVCDYARAEDIMVFMHKHSRVDMLDMDIEHAEEELLLHLELRSMLQERVARLIVATHSATKHERLRGLLQHEGWLLISEVPFTSNSSCLNRYLHPVGHQKSPEELLRNGCYYEHPGVCARSCLCVHAFVCKCLSNSPHSFTFPPLSHLLSFPLSPHPVFGPMAQYDGSLIFDNPALISSDPDLQFRFESPLLLVNDLLAVRPPQRADSGDDLGSEKREDEREQLAMTTKVSTDTDRLPEEGVRTAEGKDEWPEDADVRHSDETGGRQDDKCSLAVRDNVEGDRGLVNDDVLDSLDVNELLASVMGRAGQDKWPAQRIDLLQQAFLREYSPGFESCDRAYLWWRNTTESLASTQNCMDRLLALAPRWRCIGAGCSTCTGQCEEVLKWELDGAQGRRDPSFLKQNTGYRESSYTASESELLFEKSVGPGFSVLPYGRSLIAVMSAPGESFRARREHSEGLLTAMQVAGVLSTAVTLDMVQQGGWLESCVALPQAGGAGLSATYFASGLNHLHTFIHALRVGFENLIVLEDDMMVRLAQGRKLFLTTSIVFETLHDAEKEEYDLLSFGECAGIHADPTSDDRIHIYGSLVEDDEPEGWDPSVYRELWRVSKGSRCAGAYAVSRAGMLKVLLHLPMWCTMDWVFNGAKKAVTSEFDVLRTKVLFLEPPLFYEGSKQNMFGTTMTGCHYCPSK
jgi:hypothetical protein